MRRLLPAVVAVLAPALLVTATLGWLARPEPAAEAAPLAPDVKELAARIAGGADMVILGNSKVDSDLDVNALAKLAGMDPKRVVKMNLYGTNAPIWYAVLKRRVYDAGHRPKVVVVYSTLAMMVQVEMLSETLQAQLARNLGTPDPAVDEKVYGKERVNPTWERVRNRRTELHAALLEDLRNGMVGLFFAPPGEGPLTERGASVAEPALATVFNTDAMTAGDRVRAVPIAEAATAAAAEDAGPADADATMIPDLVALAREHGSEIVFVRSPMGSLKHGHDVVARPLEESVVAKLGELGAAWVDLSKDGPPDSGYGDGSHMNGAGRAKFMPKVIAALEAIGLGEGGPLVPAKVGPSRPAPTITRVGEPAPIDTPAPIRGKLPCDYQIMLPKWKALADNVLTDARIGPISPLVVLEDGVRLTGHADPKDVNQRCTGSSQHWNGVMKFSPSGDDPEAGKARTYRVALDPSAPVVGGKGQEAWWVYPGTALRFTFAEGALQGEVAAAVTARPFLGGAGAPTIRFVGTEAPLSPAGDSLAGSVKAAATGSVILEVASPADGPLLLLDRVALGAGDAPWYVLGAPPQDTTVDLLGHPVTYAAPPKALPGPTKMPVEAHWKKGTWVFPLAGLEVPPIEETAKLGASCSPLRLAIDGVPAETPIEGAPPKTTVANVTHSNDRLLVRFHDAAEPKEPASRYSFSLDAERLCGKHARWFGPGDDGTFSLPSGALSPLRDAATALRITGGVFYAKPDDTATVQVTSAGETLVEETLPFARFADGQVELPLSRPLPRDAAVDVRIRSTGWLLVTFAELTEAAPDLFAEAAP